MVKYLTQLASKQEVSKRIEAFVRDLSSNSFDKREKASQRLTAIGYRALPSLLEAIKEGDAESVRRATECVELIRKDDRWGDRDAELAQAAIRRLVTTHPEQALEALFCFLPSADETTVEHIWIAAERIVLADGKVNPLMQQKLADSAAMRRSLAAFLLACHGNAEQRAAACEA